MHMHGIVMTAELRDDPADADKVELHLVVQGVGRGQPRRVIIPMDVLVSQPEIDPDIIKGHAFQAEVDEAAPNRWIVSTIAFASDRVLRPEGS